MGEERFGVGVVGELPVRVERRSGFDEDFALVLAGPRSSEAAHQDRPHQVVPGLRQRDPPGDRQVAHRKDVLLFNHGIAPNGTTPASAGVGWG